jgi:8-oxo-dGTP pyrophosphatase MutT (NUDIX family)
MVGKSKVKTLVSSGGVVYRMDQGNLETVLCGRSDPVRWSLAKGTPDPGETLEETALREVHEETGLEVELDSSLGSIDYWFADRDSDVRYHKTVHFYLMVPVGGATDQHDPEFDVVQWFQVDEALKAMAYVNEADVLRRALAVIQEREGQG